MPDWHTQAVAGVMTEIESAKDLSVRAPSPYLLEQESLVPIAVSPPRNNAEFWEKR